MRMPWKNIWTVVAASFVIGVVIGDGLTWLICIARGVDGIVAQEMVDEFGEPVAILMQTLLCGFVGVVGFGGTFVYHDERFGITEATLIHGVVIISLMMAVSTICWWNGRTLQGALIFLGFLLLMYLFIWFSMFLSYRAQISEINEMIEKRRSEK